MAEETPPLLTPRQIELLLRMRVFGAFYYSPSRIIYLSDLSRLVAQGLARYDSMYYVLTEAGKVEAETLCREQRTTLLSSHE